MRTAAYSRPGIREARGPWALRRLDMDRAERNGTAVHATAVSPGFRLTRFFSLASIVGLLVVTAGLIWVYQVITVRLLVEHESRANADLTRAFANAVWRDYRDFVIESRGQPREALLQDPVVPRLRADVLGKMGGLRIAKIKIYNVDGVTVFSTEERQIGEVKTDNAGFLRARGGEVASDITYRDRFDAFEGVLSSRSLIYSYIPVRAADDAPVEGVFEVYSDVTDLVLEQQRARWQLAAVLLAALAALYLFLLVVVRKADQVIARQEVERANQEAAIRHQAHHDPLTGLPNRTDFGSRLGDALAQAGEAGASGALLFIDLDRFKLVNDTIGHEAGDRLLKAAAERIRRCLRSHDILFRMGGDEFTALLPRISSPDYAAHAARRINQAVAAPFRIEEADVRIGATVGIAVFPADGDTPERIVRNADAAMYSCKAFGRGSHAFYQASMNADAAERLRMEGELREAFGQDRFRLYYQPRIDAVTRRMVAVEALLRWEHPQRGLLAPAEFLGVLQDMTLMDEVGEWVLRTAVRQLQGWQDVGVGPLRVSVNVSARQFEHPHFVQTVSRVLTEAQARADSLELELTESLLIPDPEAARRILQDLGALGVKVAIDDYGAGLTSLERLRTLPVDILKIDRSLVAQAVSSQRDRAIAAAIASVGRALGITVIVEGVETDAQAAVFADIRCAQLQGYLFSPPVPPDRIPALFTRAP